MSRDTKVMIGVLGIFGAAWLVTHSSPHATLTPAQVTEHSIGHGTPRAERAAIITAATSSGPAIPSDQVAFAQATADGMSAFESGANDLQKGKTRTVRARAICRALPSGRFNDWVGTIYKLTTNGDGKGVLEIEVGPKTWIKTWNNSFSDISDNTLIGQDTRLFATLSDMKEGQKVAVSGSFMKSDKDCFEESSMSIDGSMTEPEFIVRFSDARPID